MSIITITRVPGDVATQGRLVVGDLSLFTLELPWRHNEAENSCVPLGVYALIPYNSPKHGNTWCLENPALGVTSDGAGGTRSRCEIHSANWASQLLGCIAVGLDNHPMLNLATGAVEPAVESSRDALVELIAFLGPMSEGHTLNIVAGSS